MTELSTSLIVFLILTVIFQIVALRTFENELLWAKSDYLWLGIAALGIVSLTADAREDQTQRLIPIQKEHLHGMADTAEGRVHFSLNYLTLFIEMGVENEPPEIDKQKQEYTTLKERLLPYLKSMKEANWTENVGTFYRRDKLLEGLTDTITLNRANSVSDSFDSVTASYQELLALEERLNPTIWETLKLYLGAILIAVALAVRFGKTTADIKRKLKASQNG